ncbi:MAG: SRPBCC family protein [Ignavibacterium sp.]|jgi:ribosome-associated toxin RatA of RatAB toxin-antitoxin module|uniref:SRPBCC family protein n=1 Tax=Ignavibacterium sp. TaxID=2651167 RepID=UPI0032971864
MRKIIASDAIRLSYPIEKVWPVISDISAYVKWWPKLVNLEIVKATQEIVGTVLKASPLGGKSFSTMVDEIIPYQKIKIKYFDGLYRGDGFWIIENENQKTILTYKVDLEIVDPFTKLISYILPVSKIHSLIFKKILGNLERYIERK